MIIRLNCSPMSRKCLTSEADSFTKLCDFAVKITPKKRCAPHEWSPMGWTQRDRPILFARRNPRRDQSGLSLLRLDPSPRCQGQRKLACRNGEDRCVQTRSSMPPSSASSSIRFTAIVCSLPLSAMRRQYRPCHGRLANVGR